MPKSGDSARRRQEKHERLLQRNAENMSLGTELEGAVFARITHADGERVLYAFLPPDYDSAKVPALESAIEQAKFSNDDTFHRSVKLSLPGGQRSTGIAVNDGILHKLPEISDLVRINDLNTVNIEIARTEIGREFAQRDSGRDRR